MNQPETPEFDPTVWSEPLPPDLAAAVDQARSRQPTEDMVARLTARASQIGASMPAPQPVRRTAAVPGFAGVTVAAALILVACIFSIRPKPDIDKPSPPVAIAAPVPVYSPVTTRSLVADGFDQIEADLRRAEQQIEAAQESVVMAEVRRDLDQALAQYRHWNE